MKLSKDVFRALATVAWADGEVTTSEARALVRAASAAGLSDVDLDDVERATTHRTSLSDLEELALTRADAEWVYAVACVLGAADGKLVDEERASIERLGDLLRLTNEERESARRASLSFAQTIGASTYTLEVLAHEIT